MKTVLHTADSRGYFDHDWLKTYHTFSFADYYNKERVHFGALRVLNDDKVLADNGFGRHPHQNMEVISIPLKGELQHGDSLENSEIISDGEIQLMSAGTGIYHSELNPSKTEPVEFLQIWVFPKEQDIEPKYSSYSIKDKIKKNTISEFIAPGSEIEIHQDSWFSLADYDVSGEAEYKLHLKTSGVYLFVIEGEVHIEENHLGRRDGIGIWETDSVKMKIEKGSKVLIIEVPMEFR